MPGRQSAANQAGVLRNAYHGLDIRVRYGIKLVELQLVVGANVDIGSPVLGGIAVFGGGEDCND